MQVAKHNLRPSFSAPLSRSLRTFWAWWVGELSAMLPEDVRRAFRPGGQQLILALDGADLLVDRRSGDTTTRVGRYALGPNASPPPELSAQMEAAGETGAVVLCLPADKVLTRTLKLPLATEENLREVLAFQMDRQTPFTIEQVYYDYAVVARERKTRTLSVDLVVVPRAAGPGERVSRRGRGTDGH
jgi:general secretion pathway protein L